MLIYDKVAPETICFSRASSWVASIPICEPFNTFSACSWDLHLGSSGDSFYSETSTELYLDEAALMHAEAFFVLCPSSILTTLDERENLKRLEKDACAILIDVEKGHENALAVIVQNN